MSENQNVAVKAGKYEEKDDASFIEILTVLARRKKTLILAPVVVGITAAVIAYFLPNAYKANTKILPPQQAQAGAAALLSQLSGVAGVAAGAAGIKNPNDLYVGMLNSRRIGDKLIERFDLKRAYRTDSQEKARKKLQNSTSISSGKDGLITIEVEDAERQRVAQIANGYAEELLKLTKVLAVTEASQRRLFFERQLENSKNNLADAELALKKSIELHGVISVDSDSRAIVETVSRLRAQISAKEIQLSAMRAFMTPDNQEYKRAQEELSGMRSEFSKLQYGRAGADGGSLASGAKGGLDNIKIVREVKYQQMLYELLSKQYEVARLDETKDASIIQVLDIAVDPERPFRPNRIILVFLVVFFSFFATIGWILFSESRKKSLLEPEYAMKWENLKASLRWK